MMAVLPLPNKKKPISNFSIICDSITIVINSGFGLSDTDTQTQIYNRFFLLI